ncbi:helix-turn-helix transcriptional regulator [Thiolapillus sp.]|uniref:helix-turn-helix transcriptional regulator n=1 Tax=Thiolapillus sp. TaxID=2017437 RepID=UPI003AF8F6CE
MDAKTGRQKRAKQMKKSGENLAKEIKKLMEEVFISENKTREKINEFIKMYQYKMEELQKGNEDIDISFEELELMTALKEAEEEQKELYEDIKTTSAADKNFHNEMEKSRTQNEELKIAAKAMNDLKGTEHEKTAEIAYKHALKESEKTRERIDKAYKKSVEIAAKTEPEAAIIKNIHEMDKIKAHKKEPWTPKKQWLTTKETMELSKISRTTIHNKIKKGLFPAAIKIGKKSVWNKEEIENWINGKEHQNISMDNRD